MPLILLQGNFPAKKSSNSYVERLTIDYVSKSYLLNWLVNRIYWFVLWNWFSVERKVTTP